MKEEDNMDIMIIILIFADVFLFGMILFTYSAVTQAYDFSTELADLLSRTLKQYYQTENIEPQLINNGIDLVWNPNNEDTSAKRGFITVLTQDANIDSPIKDVKEADILCEKLLPVVDKHIQDELIKEK